MNSLLHPKLDLLYRNYKVRPHEDWDEVILDIKWLNDRRRAKCIWKLYPSLSIWEIWNLEWTGYWHELMILFLIESYYWRVQTIRLEAVPILTVHKEQVTEAFLVDFYERFWFQKDLLLRNPKYPHKIPMILRDWKWLIEQVKRYVTHSIPQT